MEDKKEPLMTVKRPDGSVHELSVEELCLTNNLTYQALVSLLVKQGIIDPKALLNEVERVQRDRLEKNE